jgi:hypothetical protein
MEDQIDMADQIDMMDKFDTLLNEMNMKINEIEKYNNNIMTNMQMKCDELDKKIKREFDELDKKIKRESDEFRAKASKIESSINQILSSYDKST